MKPIEELEKLLVDELFESIPKIDPDTPLDYYNEVLGNSSFLLAGILEQHLTKDVDGWGPDRWIDDSLLTEVLLNKSRVLIGGVMIWGRGGTTEQWTDRFYFEIMLNEKNTTFSQYTFLFGDSNNSGIPYEDFDRKRHLWDRQIYSNGRLDPFKATWLYMIDKKNA